MQEKNLITSQERALWTRERKSASSHTEANMVMALNEHPESTAHGRLSGVGPDLAGCLPWPLGRGL